MGIFLNDSCCRNALFPFTHTRHTADIRIGILTIKEKWELLGEKVVIKNEDAIAHDQLTVMANIIPTRENYKDIILAAKENKPLLPSNEIK